MKGPLGPITGEETDEEIRQWIDHWADKLEQQGVPIKRDQVIADALARRDKMKEVS